MATVAGKRHMCVRGRTQPRHRLQIRDAAAFTYAGERLGPRAHPGSLGVRNARNAPRPNPEACPVPRRTPVQAQPHRLRSKRDATRRPGAAGGAGRPCSADACEEGPSPRACKSSTSCTSALGCAATHGGGTSPAGPTGDRHDAHVVSREHVPHRDGGLRVARRTRALGRHDGDHRRQKAARGSALLVPGDKKRALKPPLVPALPERGRARAQWRRAATPPHRAPPARASSIETTVLAGYHPLQKAGRDGTRPHPEPYKDCLDQPRTGIGTPPTSPCGP